MTSIPFQRRFQRRLLRSIKRYSVVHGVAVDDAGLLQRARDRYLRSHAVQSVVLHDIWQRRYGTEEASRKWLLAQRQPIAPYDYHRFRAPPVEWWNMRRTTAGFRKLCRFSDIEMMWHSMARDLLVAQHEPGPYIGDWPGRGRERQMRQVLSAITCPLQGVVAADIRQAFAAFRTSAAYDLPHLPDALIRRAIDPEAHRFIRREGRERARDIALDASSALEVAPSGLMEGSPASNAVFSVMLDDLPGRFGEGVAAFVYCDNIILIAPTMLHARQANNVLVRYLASHRAGSFEVRSSIAAVSEPFEHLGYSVRWDNDNGPVVALSERNLLRFGARIDDEAIPLEETLEWLSCSFAQCSDGPMEEAMTRVVDEAVYRQTIGS